jgi:hypothetical protein
MSIATLQRANNRISHLARQFGGAYLGGGQKTISSIKKVIVITTNKASVKASRQILDDVKYFMDNLPEKAAEVKAAQIKTDLSKTNKNLKFITQIIDEIYSVIDGEGAQIEVDDKNMKTFISNITKTKEALHYGSDYLLLVQSVMTARKEIKEGKSKTYTIDEFLAKQKS